jgi:hypothetical protein
MTSKRILGPRSCLLLACLALLCAAPPPAGAQSAQPRSALDLATTWIYALKRGDTRVLERTSAYPFELRMEKAPCNCEGGRARNSTEFAQLLNELVKTEDVQALEVTSGDAKEILKEKLPDWATRWSKRLPKGTRLVQLESADGGAHAITYVLLIKNDQVHALWLNASR